MRVTSTLPVTVNGDGSGEDNLGYKTATAAGTYPMIMYIKNGVDSLMSSADLLFRKVCTSILAAAKEDEKMLIITPRLVSWRTKFYSMRKKRKKGLPH